MEQAPYINVVVVLHAAFAAVFFFLNHEKPSRFARLFAWCWTIEAIRAAILLPEVHLFAGLQEQWFATADVLCFVANWCLIAGFADLFAVRLLRWLKPAYLVTGISFVLFGRFLLPSFLNAAAGLSYDEVAFYGVFANLLVMFVPVAAARLVILGWLYVDWRSTRIPGAAVAMVFSLPYAFFAFLAPVQYWFGFNPGWIAFLWCVRVLGFSIGLVMLLLSRQQAAVAKSEAALRHRNRLYAMLSDVDQTIVRVREPSRIFESACRIAVERGRFLMSWIGRLQPEAQSVSVVAQAGASPEVLQILESIVGALPRGEGCAFTARALHDGVHAVCNDIAHDPESTGWREPALRFGYRAMASFPLRVNGSVIGTFNLYAAEGGFFDEDELQLLDQLAVDIGFAVEVGERETERRLAVEALQASEERFRQVAETIREVFWLSDPEYRSILYVSPAYEAIWGRSCESLYAAPDSWWEAVHAEDRDAARKTARDLIKSGNSGGEYRVVRPDGTIRWIRAQSFPVCDAAGHVYRVAGVAEDITERKRVEGELMQAQKLEAIGRLSGGVAHDFNNLLTVIKGNVEQLQLPTAVDGEAATFLQEIRDAADRAATLTQQLLAFSRRHVLRLTDVDVNVLVADIGKMLRRILGQDIALNLKLATEPMWVRADAGMMDQILLNLVVNARDAMPRGGRLEIETSLAGADRVPPAARDSGAETLVCLAVSDTGHGIPIELQQRVFEPFFTTKEIGRGTGLGLATVYGIVQQHHGWITVESDIERGTTFRVFLANQTSPVVEHPRPESMVDDVPVRAKATILIAEDDVSVQRLTKSILEKQGYEVVAAETAEEALQLWKTHHDAIDLLLTDLVMPGEMGGVELAHRLLQEKPDLRVIYTSGYSAEIAGRDFPLPQGCEFIPKPFDIATLVATVRQSLAR